MAGLVASCSVDDNKNVMTLQKIWMAHMNRYSIKSTICIYLMTGLYSEPLAAAENALRARERGVVWMVVPCSGQKGRCNDRQLQHTTSQGPGVHLRGTRNNHTGDGRELDLVWSLFLCGHWLFFDKPERLAREWCLLILAPCSVWWFLMSCSLNSEGELVRN